MGLQAQEPQNNESDAEVTPKMTFFRAQFERKVTQSNSNLEEPHFCATSLGPQKVILESLSSLSL